MEIKGIDGMTVEQINRELQNGAKFVIFKYAISLVLMTFQRPSSIYFIRAGESGARKSLGFTALTFFLGWWGIPWGPIYSIAAIGTNLAGGKDVTKEVLQAMNAAPEKAQQGPVVTEKFF